MSRPSLWRSLVAALVAVGAWSGAARAEGPNTPGPYTVAPFPAQPKPTFFYKLSHPLEPITCWQHHNSDYNFGTFRSEATYIFSSSRAFFNEPCYKNGPPENGPCTTGGCYKR